MVPTVLAAVTGFIFGVVFGFIMGVIIVMNREDI